jgi:hypothetical protein
MEDFFDIKSSKIDDKQINLFGIFDGRRFFLVDYLSFLNGCLSKIFFGFLQVMGVHVLLSI